MTLAQTSFGLQAQSYLQRLQGCFSAENLDAVESLAQALRQAWVDGRQVFICGNGGSAANALHLANDLHYGIGACGPGPKLPGLRVEALPANSGVITCLANDTGYDNIYAHQLEVKARAQDLLIVLSGSGNSANVIRALETATNLSMTSFAVVAFSGGRCRELADVAIHFAVNDMQIAEDTQLVVGHLCMQWLNTNKPDHISR
jgi:D-sedoheptulose 7-phosphate isomerase